MSFRILLPGILWLGAMFLLFSTPFDSTSHLFFDSIPSRSIIHLFMFMGFVHIWMGICKKQLSNNSIKRKALSVVLISAIVLAFVSELYAVGFGFSAGISIWNLAFDIVGTVLGIFTFRLLYATCY